MSDLQQLSLSNIEFGVDLYKKLSESDPNSNIFFSPMSISLALAMTSLGAKGNTETELKSVLKLDKISEDRVHPLFRQFIKHLQETNDKYVLLIANKLYGEKSNTFLKNFLESCKEHYGAGLEPVDFQNNARGCESLINKWVEEQTNHKIKNLIPSGSLDASTQLILINAIYFKGSWKTPFHKNSTEEDSFFIKEDDIVKVPLMHFNRKNFNYYFHDDLNCQILELPYVDCALSFIAILPDLTKTNLNNVELKLTGLTLQKIFKKFKSLDVNVWLPKFKLESQPDVLSNLKELGMIDLFHPGKADLSNMNGAKNLVVSSILHKAFIEVNEEGSEAAAATAVVAMKKCARMHTGPRPVDFKADHPFLFLIKDNTSGSVLFMGKFLKP